MRIQSGKLDRRITILNPSKDRSATGQEISSWVELATIYGERLELRTADVASGAGERSNSTGKYKIRYRTDINTAQRVRIDGRTFAITGTEEPDRRAVMILFVEGVE